MKTIKISVMTLEVISSKSIFSTDIHNRNTEDRYPMEATAENFKNLSNISVLILKVNSLFNKKLTKVPPI